MRIAVIGTGGVGGYMGARLAASGHEVVFVARGAHLEAMQRSGLRLESPEGSLHVKGLFTRRLEGLVPPELVIIAVKSFDTPEAAAIAREAILPTTTVLSIQNGVENEDLLAERLGKEHILAGVAYIASSIAAPGVILHAGGTGLFKIGEPAGGITGRLSEVCSVFQGSGIRTEGVESILPPLWEKWVFICGLGGMTAYSRKTIGEVLADPGLEAMLEETVHEAAAVARLRMIDPFRGLEEKALAHYRRLPASMTSSMHYDVTHGKRTEVEALNGAAVRFGRALSFPTPANETISRALQPSAA